MRPGCIALGLCIALLGTGCGEGAPPAPAAPAPSAAPAAEDPQRALDEALRAIVLPDPTPRRHTGAELAMVSAADAHALLRRFPAQTLQVEVRCCDAHQVDEAVGIALAEQAAADLPDDTPVFVLGRQRQQAERTAARLRAAGLWRVLVALPAAP